MLRSARNCNSMKKEIKQYAKLKLEDFNVSKTADRINTKMRAPNMFTNAL